MIAKHFDTKAVIRRFAEPRYRTIGIAAQSFKDAPPLADMFVRLLKEYIDNWTL